MSEDIVDRLLLRNARLRALVQCLLDSDPSEPVADSGEQFSTLGAKRPALRWRGKPQVTGNR